MTPTRVVVLGSTGSIGRQALEVVAAHRDRLEVVALAAGSDAAALARQVETTGARHHGLGADAAVELAALPDADVVLNAIVGFAGLRASIAALEAGKVLALANKESLVAGGEVCVAAMRAGGGRIVPVDSEHAALAQLLAEVARTDVERVTLTASGGPFRTRRDLEGITPKEALRHPTWSMGPKITIDSATMMNKGLEVIEAHWLFDLGYDAIDVVVHPQSVVHGMVALTDGTTLMHAAPPDMRIPIAAALAHPQRLAAEIEHVDLVKHGSLEFEAIDHDRFPLVGLAYGAGRRGGTVPAVLNAANEVAVEAFLGGRLSFTGIADVVAAVVDGHEPTPAHDLAAVAAADAAARAATHALVEEARP